jgi:hypothetical protein
MYFPLLAPEWLDRFYVCLDFNSLSIIGWNTVNVIILSFQKGPEKQVAIFSEMILTIFTEFRWFLETISLNETAITISNIYGTVIVQTCITIYTFKVSSLFTHFFHSSACAHSLL